MMSLTGWAPDSGQRRRWSGLKPLKRAGSANGNRLPTARASSTQTGVEEKINSKKWRWHVIIHINTVQFNVASEHLWLALVLLAGWPKIRQQLKRKK
jgi:hypothetical protein